MNALSCIGQLYNLISAGRANVGATISNGIITAGRENVGATISNGIITAGRENVGATISNGIITAGRENVGATISNSLISAGRLDSQGLALIVAAIAVACFTVVFTVLFVNYRKFAVAEVASGKRDIELIELYFHEREKSVQIRKKALRILKVVIYTVLMAFITVCLVFTAFVRFSKDVPIGTKSLMVVASGSMSEKNKLNDYLFTNNLNDQFPTYAIIVLEKVDTSKIKQYDVIAYRHPSGKTYIHRIRSVETASDGKITYRTRGDAVASDDQSSTTMNVVTTPDDVIGKYTGVYIPFLGAFVQFMQSAAGMVTVAALVFCLFMFDRNTQKINDAQDKRTDYLVKALDIKDIHEDSEITVDFVEKIYLDKVGYLLNEHGASIHVEDKYVEQVEQQHVENLEQVTEYGRVEKVEQVAEHVKQKIEEERVENDKPNEIVVSDIETHEEE